jgi:hypothetical protein
MWPFKRKAKQQQPSQPAGQAAGPKAQADRIKEYEAKGYEAKGYENKGEVTFSDGRKATIMAGPVMRDDGKDA